MNKLLYSLIFFLNIFLYSQDLNRELVDLHRRHDELKADYEKIRKSYNELRLKVSYERKRDSEQNKGALLGMGCVACFIIFGKLYCYLFDCKF